jgi:hypothetical protein
MMPGAEFSGLKISVPVAEFHPRPPFKKVDSGHMSEGFITHA